MIYYKTIDALREGIHQLPTMREFVAPYHPQIKCFKDLTKEQRAAIIVYMVDGAWDDVLEEVDSYPESIEELLTYDWMFVKKYGAKQFGVVNIPTDVMKDTLSKTESWIAAGDGDVDLYYSQNKESLTHYYSDDWPVILSSNDYFAEELLQDGWHRFNVYIQRKLPIIPCIFYV